VYILLFSYISFYLFFFTTPLTSAFYTLSLHDALPICGLRFFSRSNSRFNWLNTITGTFSSLASDFMPLEISAISCCIKSLAKERSEEHTSELQSLRHLVCRLLLEKKKKTQTITYKYTI